MNLIAKTFATALPIYAALASSSAFAKSELLADLSCDGQTKKGEAVHFQVDGVSNVVRIAGETLKFSSVEKDGSLTEVKAKGDFKVYLSKKYKHFEMKFGNKPTVKGTCVDSMTGKSDIGDDTEQTDLPEIIGD